jgi:hypothetical protein
MRRKQFSRRHFNGNNGVDIKAQQVRVVNSVADELKMNASSNYQLKPGLMNYIKSVYGSYTKGDLITLSKIDGRNLSTTSTYNIDIKIDYGEAKEIELLLNPDYLITVDYQKVWQDNYFDNNCKFSVGMLLMNDRIYDLMVNAIDVKGAIKYRLLSSNIDIDAKCYHKMVSINSEPRILFKHVNTELANIEGVCYPTAVTNYSVFDDARVVGPDVRESKKLSVCFTTREVDMDKIGYLDRVSPIISGGYDNGENKPENIQYIENNIVNNQTNVEEVKRKFNNVKIAIEAYKLWVESFSVLRTKLHSKRRFLYAKIITPDNVNVLTLHMTSIYQLLMDEYASNIHRPTISKYQFSIARDLKRLREILYFQDLNELRTAFGEENGIYNVSLTRKQRLFIQRLNRTDNKKYKLDMLSVLYKL